MGLVVILFLLCGVIILLGGVPLKMLPFDNKNELQLVVSLPAGSTLEQTNRAVGSLETVLDKSKYVTSYTSYVGQPSPMDFNGMVRHYYLRQADNFADIRVNLLPKGERSMQSHEIGLLLRSSLQVIAAKYNARLSIVEMPPGPPVMQTLVAQIEAPESVSYAHMIDAAQYVQHMLQQENLVVDVDNSSVAEHKQLNFIVDKEKAALNGISAQQIAQTLHLALGQDTALTLHKPHEREPLAIAFDIPRKSRADINNLYQLTVAGSSG
ncbi:MAG: efflux RND transporter permease subunit, partial [Candidatus Thioglobus sp.]